MRKKTVYWLPETSLLVILAALFMICSAVVRIVYYAGERYVSGGTIAFQILLPVAANILFALLLFTCGRDRFYRTAIPVWLGCMFFAVKAAGFPSLTHMLLCLLLYALVAALYTATVTGRIPTQALLYPLFALPLLYHVFIEDPVKLQGQTLRGWLPEVSVLLCMAALLAVSVSIRKKKTGEGEYVRRFGDRCDGRRLRSLSPIFAVSPYIMKTRNTSQNFIEDHIECSNMERYIQEKRAQGMEQFGVLHVILAAYVRACAKYPGLNRFVSGQRIYSRDGEIEVAMTVKKEMRTDSPDTVIKVYFTPEDTAASVYDRFHAKVLEVKNAPEDTGFDSLARVMHFIPGLVLKFVVWLLEVLDYFGELPRGLLRLSPFHGSLYITSMASLGIPPIYHHLYDFGNVPVFCSFGKKRRVRELDGDGTVVVRKYVDCNFVTDERIVDGFYFASVMRYLHNLLHDPWQLDQPPEEVARDVE
ncbi:hypothetical protein H8790_04460 [Oscillibacter hominis]|uniref:2-oxoacid dehydrogenase acyltransferase catalytic domain-containing protein n=1 Tax=Oscillibacter hominis TaxID=2763056 RepID=A0A7G9B6U3_9FIRM|nr:hypothetical protein [Oscillibacter hominis]QNL45274.1 hypothetical protein H8790_04460 [Oscillibacter hominis]